ncbi:MAG: hypothetical protein Q4P29_00025 [Tissierellia bacterium]|nr:hypothetical protein [Tissierellia bacterium]
MFSKPEVELLIKSNLLSIKFESKKALRSKEILLNNDIMDAGIIKDYQKLFDRLDILFSEVKNNAKIKVYYAGNYLISRYIKIDNLKKKEIQTYIDLQKEELFPIDIRNYTIDYFYKDSQIHLYALDNQFIDNLYEYFITREYRDIYLSPYDRKLNFNLKSAENICYISLDLNQINILNKKNNLIDYFDSFPLNSNVDLELVYKELLDNNNSTTISEESKAYLNSYLNSLESLKNIINLDNTVYGGEFAKNNKIFEYIIERYKNWRLELNE